MELFGANALFLAPEYLGKVNAAAAAITGIAAGIFIMSWNITTFILHSIRFRFLATSSKPFLKYCLNNAIIPVAFLLLYFGEALYFDLVKELIPVTQFLLIVAGFLGGFFLLVLISFIYFFNADRRIIRTFKPGFIDFDENRIPETQSDKVMVDTFGLPVKNYLSTQFKVKQVRLVGHYSQDFLDIIFKRHHFAAMITILLAFIFMIFIAFFLDKKIFQVPAAASIFIFFAILIAVIGALSYFLRSWSLLFVIFLYGAVNLLYKYNIIDPRNKAYGLNYSNPQRPEYTLAHLKTLNTPQKIEADKKNMIAILNNWKANQAEEKPMMVFFNFSGGGVRSASFAMNVLQQLDSITDGTILKKTMMMSGASGGMLAAAYFRELTFLRNNGAAINLSDQEYVDNISKDLLNPVFSSLIARDLLAPSQKFTFAGHRYIKDRGYAFEQKLNANTGNVLRKTIGDYREAESTAQIPLLMLSATVTKDFKKMLVSTQPISFMMQSAFKDRASDFSVPDAIDFGALFKNEGPMNLGMLTALRMNATYPYVLPNVWLPTNPVIDVMDAGLRDNSGEETSLRFMNVFKDWITENTRGVLIIQVRSRRKGTGDDSYKPDGILDVLTNPFTMMQDNWFKLQDYYQDDEIEYLQNALGNKLQRVSFMYIPKKQESGATLNFHLTASEKKEVKASLHRENNLKVLESVKNILEITDK
jgi:hypothetical protein